MVVLLLLRHLKAAKGNPSLPDRDRPLNARDRAAAAAVVRHLKESPESPTLVLCSPARRTQETLELIRPALAPSVRIRSDETLYGGGPTAILAALGAHGPGHHAILVIGHNPDLENLAVDLAGTGDADSLDRLKAKFPTGALAVLIGSGEGWSRLRHAAFHLAAFSVPADA